MSSTSGRAGDGSTQATPHVVATDAIVVLGVGEAESSERDQ